MNAPIRLMALALSLVFLPTLSATDFELAHVEDLEVTLRSFPTEVVYGDPLYIELEVVNRGKNTARAMPPAEGNIGFRAMDEDLGVAIDCSMARLLIGDADFGVVDYAPGQSRKYFFQIFLPKTHQLGHPFWRGVENRANVTIDCQLWLRSQLRLTSDRTWARISPRDERELEALRRWSRLEPGRKELDTKILPGSVGSMKLYDVRTRQDTKDIAAVVKSGELGDLLQLTLRLQELESSPANREDGNQALVEWVKRQPDIKRQWLANRLRNFEWLLSPAALKSLENLAE